MKRTLLILAILAATLSGVPAGGAPAQAPNDLGEFGGGGAGAARQSISGSPVGVLDCQEPSSNQPEPAWAAQLPPARATTVTTSDVTITSRDGTALAARVYRPDAYTGRLPTVLWFNPYSTQLGLRYRTYEGSLYDSGDALEGCYLPFFLKRGYAVVWADMRGTGDSEGCPDYLGPRDQEDGYAVVQWIAAQPWSSGRVGMHGYSWPGASQYAAAAAAPPALKAIVPVSAPDFYALSHPGATLSELGLFYWAAGTYAIARAPRPPCPEMLEFQAHASSTDGTLDDYWAARSMPLLAARSRVPVLATFGYPADGIRGFGSMWEALERHGVPRKAYIGPWAHWFPEIPWWPLYELRWFEHWVRGHDTGMMDEPTLTLFDQTGAQHAAERFPASHELVLQPGAGALAVKAPRGSAVYRDVPGTTRVATRNGIASLRYETAPLPEPLVIGGTPRLELVAAIHQPDTNFAVHLFDLGPDGIGRFVTAGYLDARHRQGIDRPGTDVEPGKRLRYDIQLEATVHRLEAGHRLQLVVASSDVMGPMNQLPDLTLTGREGIVSDGSAARVEVFEGPGATRLVLQPLRD